LTADVVFINAKVRTLDPAGSVAEAVAVRDGEIIAVGTTDQVRELAGKGTDTIDAQGHTLLPALTDSHTHFHRASLVLAFHIDYMALAPASMTELLAPIRRRAAEREPGKWIEGDNLDPALLAEGRFPTRRELDAVAPRHPVVLRGVGRHVVAANSLALAHAGIDRNTPDPPGGRLDRDESGEPTGVLHEHGKLRLDNAQADTVIPRPGDDDRVEALRKGIEILHGYGIACIHEMAREPNDITDYLRLRERGRLKLRVRLLERGLNAYTSLDHVVGAGLRTGFGDDWIRFGGVKFSIDGSDTVRNAAVYEPYPNDPNNFGLVRIEEDRLTEALRVAHANGLEAAVHAIGQRAVDMALNAFEAAIGTPDPRLRHRIEHAYLPPRPGQLRRMADLGITLSTQASFVYSSGDAWRQIHGAADTTDSMPLRDAVRAGLTIQLNSDYPCSPLNPFVGIGSAVTRRTRSGWVVPGDQALTPDEALRMMTNACAYSTSLEGRQGSLTVGNLADIMITDQDPVECDPEKIIDTRVLLTMVGGEVVHDILR
jgi:predicted amidohydrolase YtcJ